MFPCKFAAYLQNSCFEEHLWGTTSAKFFSTCLSYFSIEIRVKFRLFSNIFLTSSMFYSEWAVLRLPDFLCSFSDSFYLNGILWSFVELSFYLIKSLSKCCLNSYVAFSFEKLSYDKNSFFFWYLKHCNIESLPEKIFSNIFISFLSPELSNYDPWNSLLVCQFPNYLVNKTIVLSNQQLVNFYENSDLKLRDLQKFSKKLDLTWGGFFETHCIRYIIRARSLIRVEKGYDVSYFFFTSRLQKYCTTTFITQDSLKDVYVNILCFCL